MIVRKIEQLEFETHELEAIRSGRVVVTVSTEIDSERPGFIATRHFLEPAPVSSPLEPVAEEPSCQVILDNSPDDSNQKEILASSDEESNYSEISNSCDGDDPDEPAEPFGRLCFRFPGVVMFTVDGETEQAISLDSVLWELFDNLDAAGERGLSINQIINAVKEWREKGVGNTTVTTAISRLRDWIFEKKLPFEVPCKISEEKKKKINRYFLARASPYTKKE